MTQAPRPRAIAPYIGRQLTHRHKIQNQQDKEEHPEASSTDGSDHGESGEDTGCRGFKCLGAASYVPHRLCQASIRARVPGSKPVSKPTQRQPCNDKDERVECNVLTHEDSAPIRVLEIVIADQLDQSKHSSAWHEEHRRASIPTSSKAAADRQSPYSPFFARLQTRPALPPRTLECDCYLRGFLCAPALPLTGDDGLLPWAGSRAMRTGGALSCA
jgi:hypothetical protein